MIKFLDITKQDKKIQKLIFNDIKRIIIKNSFILGDEVFKFESAFAKYCNTKYAVSCANGTDALTIALKVLNLPQSSEVIIPAMTYCSTAFAVINAGLKPILADIKSGTPTISCEEIKKKITKNTRVIMPVHLYGSVARIDDIKKIIRNKKIFLIDDCSQAHGAIYNGKKVGSLGDISCFSLYPGKNLGAYGDAGVITTNNKTLYNKIKNFRNLGSDTKFIHTQVGFNSRLDTIQAAILLRKIKFLDANNKKRKFIAKFYNENLKNNKISKLSYSKNCVYHQFVILTKYRNKLTNLMKKNLIPFGFHYPSSINQIDSLKSNFKKMKFPLSEKIANEGISLPIDPNLSKANLIKIVRVLNSF
ncbi:DegT/DnrJ/EryC1/StrS family aminotransferase [Candidatus Pelagibacter sp.]|nr:DegT/DnrJ/EryC1/StrS family aminotransferase [Candidatus Pelagibacter sp.]